MPWCSISWSPDAISKALEKHLGKLELAQELRIWCSSARKTPTLPEAHHQHPGRLYPGQGEGQGAGGFTAG